MTERIARILDFLVAHRVGLRRLMLALLALLVVVDVLVPPAYTRFPWDQVGGFAAFYGLLSCVLIIVLSKALGYALVYRKEGYYADEEVDGDD